MNALTFNVVLVGDGGVGKTTYLNRHLTGEFTKAYNATFSPTQTGLKFLTNRGVVTFNCIDTSGQPAFTHHYNIPAHACILMFDVTSKLSYKSLPRLYNAVKCGDNGVVVLCGNKVDDKFRKVKPEHIKFHREKNLQYYDISAKSNYNFEMPFLYLARKLTGDPNLVFTQSPQPIQ